MARFGPQRHRKQTKQLDDTTVTNKYPKISMLPL